MTPASTYPCAVVRGPVWPFRLKVSPGRISAPSSSAAATRMLVPLAALVKFVVKVLISSRMPSASASAVVNCGGTRTSSGGTARGGGCGRTVRHWPDRAGGGAAGATDEGTDGAVPAEKPQ